MRALLSMALLLAGAGCTWPEPAATPRWPAPAGFGAAAWEGAVLRAPEYAAAVSGPTLFITVRQPPGRDATLTPVAEPTFTTLAVDPRAGTSKVIANSPLPAQTPQLWPATGGVITTLSSRAARFDGASWVELPTLPTSAPDFVRGLDGGVVLLRHASALWVLGGGTWRALALDPNVVNPVFGPVSGSEVRVVYWHPSGLCTSARSLVDLTETRAPVCLPNQSELPGGEVMNGTFDDFQAWTPGLVDVQLWHFQAGMWTRGVAVRGNRLRWAPDAAFAIGSIDVTGTFPLQHLTRLEGGRATSSLFVQSWELLGCYETDLRSCARNPLFVRELVESDGSAALFLLENAVDARRVLYVKRLPLPHRDEGTCTPECGAGQLCVRGSSIANLCVVDPALAP